MSARTCPDWPRLLELVPELHFKHYTVRDTMLPPTALAALEDVVADGVALCCDVQHRIFNPRHTEPHVATALQASEWTDLREWAERPRSTAAPKPDVTHEQEWAELERLRVRLEQRERTLAERERELTRWERALTHRSALLDVQTRRAVEVRPAPRAYSIEQLERAVARRGRQFPERLPEWEVYLGELRNQAAGDGSLPDALTELVEDIFAPLLWRKAS
jgi:hypothetical protein